MIILYLTCSDKKEADTIGTALLEARLVACVKQSHVSSTYLWNKKLNQDEEILLTMESIIEKFDDIEEAVNKLHSYDQHVLTAVQSIKTSPGVETWLKESLDIN